MRNPAGEECRFYYQDFHRGRQIRECRNIAANEDSPPWRAEDCARCPVPAILRANADAALQLKVTVGRGRWGFGRRLHVAATCATHKVEIADPFTGCRECRAERPGLELFRAALAGDDDAGNDDDD